MKTSLNLSIDEDLVQRAKDEAERRGTSVSRMVEAFFASLDAHTDDAQAESSVPDDYTPSQRIRSLRSSLQSPDRTPKDAPEWDEERLIEELQRKHT